MTSPDTQNHNSSILITNIIRATGTTVILLIFTWSVFGLYTAFFHGKIPLIPWDTPHNIIFGFIWLFFIFPGAMYQARTVRNCFHSVAIFSRGWSLLPIAIFNMYFQIFGIVAIPAAWFPSAFPPPLAHIKGGILMGFITLFLAILILLPCNLG